MNKFQNTTKFKITLTTLFGIGCLVFCISFVLTNVAQAETIDASELAVFQGTTADGLAGNAVASAGDVNADGYDDILVGAYYGGTSSAGAVYLVYGQATRFDLTDLSTAITFTGEGAGDHLGYSVAAAGDINADGYADFMMGAPNYDSTASNVGAVYIVYGQASHLTSQSASALVHYYGVDTRGDLGYSVAAAGDVNGDGFSDLLFGAPYKSSYTGAAYLAYGQATTLTSATTSNLAKFSGEASYDYAGSAIAGIGDINLDGFADLAIGAPRNDFSGQSNGAVYFIYGRSSNYTSTALSTLPKLTGFTSGERLGAAVTAAGDITGDGYPDVAISATRNSIGGTDSGAVYLFYGSATVVTTQTVQTLTQLYINEADALFGSSIAGIADANLDGYADLLIGAPSDLDNENGSAYVWYGSAVPTSGAITAAEIFTGEQEGDETGARVALAGDVDGDGSNELLLGAQHYGQVVEDGGAAYLVYLPIYTCANSVSLGGILADYPTEDWKFRTYKANPKLEIVVEKKGQIAQLVNCKTNEIVQTLTFNTRGQRKILARVFTVRDLPVFLAISRTPSKRKIKLFFYEQTASKLIQRDYFTKKWRPRGFRIKLKKSNKQVLLQAGQEAKHQLLYVITRDYILKYLGNGS